MKRLIFAAALSLLAATASAQAGFNFGPRVGLNFSSVNLSSTTGLSVDGKAGYVAGLFARVDISKFTIQPELVYAVRKGKGTLGNTTFEFETQTFDVPVLVGYKFVDAKVVKARVLAGPVLSFNSKSDVSLGNVLDFPSKYVTSWQAGVAVDVWKFIVDLRYEGTFNAQLKDNLGNSAKVNLFQFGLAYKIL
jgi:hypothetical protein